MELPIYHPFRSAKAKDEYLELYDRQAKLWPAPSESRMVETSYGQSFVRINGMENAQPLVLLPGRYANSLSWTIGIETLASKYRTYAVDCIFDIGRSLPTRRIKTTNDVMFWMNELFTGLGLKDQIRLMGISFGGWLAFLYTLQFPNRLIKMAALAPVATVLPLSLQYWGRGFLAMLHPHFFRSLSYWMFADFARQGATAHQFLEQNIADLQIILRCIKLEIGLSPTVLTDQELRSLQVPTLFLVGENEKIYSAKNAVQRINTVTPQIKTKMIPGAGHDLFTVQTEMINNAILEFLK